jgi:hypothetical protein
VNPHPQGTPRPVSLANPGAVSAADYGQLKGLSFAEKVQQMRGILQEAKATRTQQQLKQSGPFLWSEGVGQRGEMLFIGAGFPAITRFPTVIVIMTTGEVYRMQPSGLRGVVSQGPPTVVDYDLNLGNAQLMVS